MQRVVDHLLRLSPHTRFLLLALVGLPFLPAILAYGLWLEHWPVARSGHPAFDDLSNLWLGAKAALSGDYVSLFTRNLHEAAVAREFGAPLTNQVWSYPPTIMVLLMPLAYLPGYAWFVAVWVGGGVALFSAALFARTGGEEGSVTWPRPDAAAFCVLAAVLLLPGTMLCINAGQTGLITSAILFFGLLNARRRPVLAGAILGLLVAKPHLGLAVPVVLLTLGAYRAIVWTAVSALAVLAASVAVLGLEPWQLFLTVTLPEHVHIVEDVAAGPDEALKLTMFMLLRAFGASKALAMGLHIAMAACVLAALAAYLRAERNFSLRFLAVALATLLTSPYLLGYELALAALAVGRVLLDAEARGRLGDSFVLGLCVLLTAGHVFAAFTVTAVAPNGMAALMLAAFGALTRGAAQAALAAPGRAIKARLHSTPV